MENWMLCCSHHWDFTPIILFIFIHIQAAVGWPEGTYGLPMAESGCPDAGNFEWLKGSRTQRTRPGSHGINNSHLAGVEATKGKPTDRIVQNFCIKTSYVADGVFEWEKGQYCIYRKDRCPTDFQEGEIYWDDSVPFIFGDDDVQDKSGALPDGDYGKNTRIYFCCRRDGHASKAIHLPTTAAFYLLELGPECQKVKGMSVEEEWVYWAGEKSLNLDDQGGVYPRLTRSKFPTKFTRLYYCYYTPQEASSNLRTALTVVYVLAGIVALIVLFFAILCIIQRCCTSSKYQESPHNAENPSVGQQQVQFMASTEESLIFRPRNNGDVLHSSETTAFFSNKNVNPMPNYSVEGDASTSSSASEMPERQVPVPSAPPSCSSTTNGNNGEKSTEITTSEETLGLVPTAPPIMETGILPIASPPSYAEVMNKAI